DAYHEVERQPEGPAVFGQGPEHGVVRCGREIRGQRNGAGPGAVGGEVLEQPGQRPADAGDVPDLDAGRLGQALAGGRFVEVEHQVVGAEAGDVSGGVEPLQRVVEVVRQEDLFDVGTLQDLGFPVGLGDGALGGVVQAVGVGGRDAVALKPEEGPGDLDE